MKTRFVCLVTVIFMLVQTFGTVSVFADTEKKVNIDFSGTVNIGSNYDIRSVSNVISGVQDYSFEKGQYGKAPDDVSMRLYTVGGSYGASTKNLTIRNDNVAVASSGEYSHLSFQFLNENLYSNLTARLTYQANNGSTIWNKTFLAQPFNSSYPKHSRVFTGTSQYNWETRPGVFLDYEHKIGTWNQIDIYFSSTSFSAIYFINGNKAEINLAGWDPSSSPVAKIKMVEFLHGIGGTSPYKPSAVQIDNVIFEKVSSVPDTQNFRYNGETLNFDDNFATGTNAYRIGYNNSGTVSYTNRFSNNTASAYPAVKFMNTSAVSVKKGTCGKKSWDNSLEINVPSDASPGTAAMHYNPGIKDIRSDDYGHLTFAMANKTDDKSCGLISSGIKLGNLVSPDIELFEMSASNGKFKFFGETVNAQWQKEKWYKIDVLFKVGDNISTYTTVDCFIDGVKYVSDYEIKANVGDYSMLESLGTLKFTDEPNANYLIDDILAYMFDSSSYNNPSDGYEILTDDVTLKDAIDNEQRKISIAGNYKAEDFLAKISNPECVKLYDASGAQVKSGLLANCIIEVSNGYGAGIYYSVETTGVVTETNLFDIADGSVILAENATTVNISAANESDPVIEIQLFVDGKLETSVNSDALSFDISNMMLGKHEFEAYAYINDKDCYMDSVSLIIIEEKENTIVSTQDYEKYVSGSGVITGGRLVQKGGKVLSETVSDKTGKDYGKSLVFQSTKEEYIAANNGHDFYLDIYTPEANMITKGMFEFDICYLTEGINFASNIRGKTSFNSTNNTAGNYSPFTLGTTTSFRGNQVSMEVNKWYNIKCMVDLKNGLTSMWIDDVPVRENVAFTPSIVQMASELRIEARLPSSKYDSVDTYRFFAIDNIAFTEYDELAYIDNIEDESASYPVDHTDDVITLKMSRAIESIDAQNITLHSTNGEREIKSVTIDSEDASVLYVTPKYPLSSSDLYRVVISPGMKSAGALSTKTNCGFFETTAKNIDVLSGDFEYKNGKMNFSTKLTNQSNSNKNLIVIAYVYEGEDFKGIAAKTVTTRAGKNMNVSLELPYYSETSTVYGLVTDNWSTLKPITNKLYSYSY